MDRENIWAFELCKLYDEKNLSQIKKRLFEITDVLVYLHEILAERKIKLAEKETYSEQLVLKIHLQNLSLLQLAEGQKIRSNFYKIESDTKFLDISSIITIVRSQYESLLMYQHLYINSESEDEQNLRFESWIMSSMMSRIKMFSNPNSEQLKDRQEREVKLIEESKIKIQNNPAFQNLNGKQQIQLLNKGTGKLFKNWDTIFEESKFSRTGVFSKIYYLASIYAHSEGILALQLKETKHLMDDEHMKELLYLMLFYSYLMTNIMIKNIVNKFDIIKERFDLLDDKIKFEIDFNYRLSFK